LASIITRRLSVNRHGEKTSWAAIRELCCRTGRNGEPIAEERWSFFAKIWVEPYEMLLPQWTYVAETDGSVIGYLTGCPDSKRFRLRVWRLILPLLGQIALGPFRHTPGARTFAWQALGIQKTAERSISRKVRREIDLSYPAHLHINIDALFRGRGVGRQLTESYVADLRREGVSGLHLFCGPDPLPFYLRLGFQILANSEFHKSPVFALGQRL
jgi:GNAT superfamily N-acetyltransferase